MQRVAFFLSCTLFVALSACTDPITVGADLLDDDRATLGQTTDVPFTTAVVRNDSLLAYQGVNLFPIFDRFSFGRIDEPVFGETTHSFYVIPTVFRDSRTNLPSPPSFAFTDRNVDSVVLILPLDTANLTYGPGRSFDFRAGLVPTRVDDDADYYTDVVLTRSLIDVNANSTFYPSATPSLLYDTAYAVGRDSVLVPHVRVRMDDNFVNNVNQRDETTFDSDSALATLVAGLFVEPVGDPDGLFGIQPRVNNATVTAGLYFFYRDTSADMAERLYRLPLAFWLPRYEKDYDEATVGELLATGNDLERVATAGQGGVMTAITFPNLDGLRDKVINQAEITFFRDTPDGYSYGDYPAPSNVNLFYRTESGFLSPIADRLFLRNPDQESIRDDFLGGNAQTDENGNVFYRSRFSVHLQDMIDGTVPPTIFLRVTPVESAPARVILRGPEAAELPAAVKVTFTEVGG